MDGVPTVEAINQRIEVTTIVGLKKKKFFTRKLETRVWYNVEIFQKKSKINPDKVLQILYIIYKMDLIDVILILVVVSNQN